MDSTKQKAKTRSASHTGSTRVGTLSKQTRFSLITPLGIIYITSFTKGKNEHDFGFAKRSCRKRFLCSSLEECRSLSNIVNKFRRGTWFGSIQWDRVLLRMNIVYRVLNTELSATDRYTEGLLMMLLPWMAGMNSTKVTAFHFSTCFLEEYIGFRPIAEIRLHTYACIISKWM